MKKIILYLVLAFTLQSCVFTKGHFTEDGSMWVWNEKPNTNQHRPLLENATNVWIQKAGKIANLKQLEIDVLAKKWCNFKVNDKGYMFEGNWMKNKVKDPENKFQKIGNELELSANEVKQLLDDFVKLGLNRYYKEKGYFIFETENWLNYDKGYIFFIKPNDSIIEKDTIDLRSLTNNNYRPGLFDKIRIERKISNNWYEWYRPTLGLQIADTIKLKKLPKIGQELDTNFTKFSKRILVFGNKKLNYLPLNVDNIKYGIAWDENSILRYIITQDQNFKTLENIEIGMTLEQVNFGNPIIQNDEMFYSLKLKSGWNLAFCEKELKYFPTINKYNGDDCSKDTTKMNNKIKWIYRN